MSLVQDICGKQRILETENERVFFLLLQNKICQNCKQKLFYISEQEIKPALKERIKINILWKLV